MFEHKDFIEHVRVDLIANLRFMNYAISANYNDRGEMYLKAEYLDRDIYTNILESQVTRRWAINPKMTDSEIVQTAFKMCLTSMEHKTREAFTYKGAQVFGPHFDVEDLVKLCKAGREAAGGRK